MEKPFADNASTSSITPSSFFRHSSFSSSLLAEYCQFRPSNIFKVLHRPQLAHRAKFESIIANICGDCIYCLLVVSLVGKSSLFFFLPISFCRHTCKCIVLSVYISQTPKFLPHEWNALSHNFQRDPHDVVSPNLPPRPLAIPENFAQVPTFHSKTSPSRCP